MSAQLVKLPDVERLSSRVIRILGGNPGKTRMTGTNTYLVGTGRSRLLVDTAEGKPSWLRLLKETLKTENATVDKVIITHWHPDHVGGIADILSMNPDIPIYKHQPDPGQQDISNNDVFRTDSATLRALHTPGHTTDHMALVLEEEDAMFTGDNVLGQGTAVFEDLETYMDSLQLMASAFSGRAYPGHGPVIEHGPAKVREYVRHRQEREAQIVEVLRAQPEDVTSMGIVKVVYKDYPENLWAPAEKGVVQVLRKLEKEGKVGEIEGRWGLSDKKL